MVNTTDFNNIRNILFGSEAEYQKMHEIAVASENETNVQLGIDAKTEGPTVDVAKQEAPVETPKEEAGGMSTKGQCSVANSAFGLASAVATGICNACIASAKSSMMRSEKQMATDQANAKDECNRADADIAKDTMNMKAESLEYAKKAKEAEAEADVSGARIDGQRSVEDAKAAEFAKNEKASEGPDSKKARDGLAYFGATGYFYG